MSSNSKRQYSKSSSNVPSQFSCLISHIGTQLEAGTFVTIIHVGNSDYLRFLHDLIAFLLLKKRWVHVFDYHRRIKLVYIQQMLQQRSASLNTFQRRLDLRVILDEDHALNELHRLQQRTPSKRLPNVFILVDPSGLFQRMTGGAKKSASALQFQYEAAQLFTQQGFAVLVADAGGREFHRIESLVPVQLAKPASIILQYLPRRVILTYGLD